MRILLTGAGGGLEATVADDGVAERRRASVEALEERARLLGAAVQVDTDEGGTAVGIAIPRVSRDSKARLQSSRSPGEFPDYVWWPVSNFAIRPTSLSGVRGSCMSSGIERSEPD